MEHQSELRRRLLRLLIIFLAAGIVLIFALDEDWSTWHAIRRFIRELSHRI